MEKKAVMLSHFCVGDFLLTHPIIDGVLRYIELLGELFGSQVNVLAHRGAPFTH